MKKILLAVMLMSALILAACGGEQTVKPRMAKQKLPLLTDLLAVMGIT
ncbi:hypothetical protein [Planococcus sp. 107-1]|nr:hypothetical protein [Planococcus sp. 107-1]UJF28423.1 hypothetical protein L0M13_08995 [Planococcus sp. 107-1]